MKIIKFKKKKSNLYEITFEDNTTLNLYDDVIIKYNLLSKKDIDKNLLKEIISANANLECYYKALKYLNIKLRSKKEVKKYLNKEYSNDIVSKTIKRLEQEKYLNDDIFLKSFINDKINLTLKGPFYIQKELINLGLKEEKIINYLNTFDDEVWILKINKIIGKKVKSNHNLGNELLKEKIRKYLIQEGYNVLLINECLNNYSFNNDSVILEKELNKEYLKLSKKYNGEELIYKIKYNLYKKGFNVSKIEDLLTHFNEN